MQTFHNRPVVQAWQTAVQEETRSRPWLTPFLLRQSPHLFTRFADYYRQLLAAPRKVRRQLGAGLATAALLLALSSSPAHAATITVTPGAAGINGGDGCSLVEAIINANHDAATYAECVAGSGADTIVLVGNTYNYTAVFGTAGALPTITSPITIEGNGATLARTGGPSFRILRIEGNLTLNNATITGGSVIAGNRGGGIYNSGTLTLSNSTVSGNSSSTSGGGIATYGGTTILTNSTISGNTAARGGGIFAYYGSTVTLNNSIVSGNTSQQRGGGVYNIQATTTINNSTLSGNSAQNGGGVMNSYGGMVTMNHSTLSGNTGTNRGGGIYNWQGTAIINNSTISGNSANYGGGFFSSYYGVATLRRTIVSGNSAPTGAEVNRYYGTINSNNHNIFGHSGLTNAQAFNGFTPSGTDVTATSNGTTPTALASILNPTLANNGGPTLTHALVTGSPAIDRAPTGSAGLIDQRGAVRDFDGNGSASANEADAGAVEFRERLTVGSCAGPELVGVQDFLFSSGTVRVDVNTAAGLNCLSVEEMGTNHPMATGSIGNPGIHTGNWWHISGNINSGFDVDVTLPFAGADADSRVCKWPGNIGGQGWDCGDDTDNTEGAGVVTRTGLGSFSDWAVGDTVDPSAVTNLLTQTTSQPPTTILALLATLLAAFSGVRLWRRR